MSYSFKKVLHNIKKNFAVYIVIVLEFALGLSIFLGCQSIMFTAQKDLDKVCAEMNNEEVYLKYYCISSDDDPYDFIFPYENYIKVKEKFKDEIVLRYAPFDFDYIGVISEPDGEVEATGFFLFFVNDEFFESIFNTKMDHSTAYVGSDVIGPIKEMIKNYDESAPKDYNYFVDSLSFKNGELKIFSKDALNIKPTPTSVKSTIPNPLRDDNLNNYKISQSIFISLDYYPEAEEATKAQVQRFNDLPEEEKKEHGFRKALTIYNISIAYPDGKYNTDTLPIFLNYINSLEGNHALFYAEQQALNVQNNVQNIKNSLNNYQLASIGLLIIVVVGNIGIITLFINRHKKAIAVSCAYGATLTGIAFETFAELLLVALAGMAVSFISLHFASPLLNDIYAGTQVEPRFVLVGLAIALVTAVIPTVAAVYSLKKISVTEILKTN